MYPLLEDEANKQTRERKLAKRNQRKGYKILVMITKS